MHGSGILEDLPQSPHSSFPNPTAFVLPSSPDLVHLTPSASIRMAPAHTDEPENAPQPRATLLATYTNSINSPTETQNFPFSISAPLPSIDSTSVKDKAAYLLALRTSTKQLQEDINVFLTQKMEEDKLHASTAEQKKVDGKAKDEIEEETYGEEGMGDEEDN